MSRIIFQPWNHIVEKEIIKILSYTIKATATYEPLLSYSILFKIPFTIFLFEPMFPAPLHSDQLLRQIHVWLISHWDLLLLF